MSTMHAMICIPFSLQQWLQFISGHRDVASIYLRPPRLAGASTASATSSDCITSRYCFPWN